jgi:hypothetical protein
MVERFYWVDMPLGKVKESRLPNTDYSWHSMEDPDGIRKNNEIITKWILWYKDGCGPNRRDMLNWSLENKSKWFLLHPSAVKRIKVVAPKDDPLNQDIYCKVEAYHGAISVE